MKRQFKSLSVLFVLIFSFSSLSSINLHVAGATYVEGLIAFDTSWTLANSPFVLSNNVTILPDVTLTIEPGVEVRFGGSFCIVVQGRLIAEGTSDRMIKFTSNKLNPPEGDWGSIWFSGSESSLIYCSIEYGTNGATLENGSLNIEHSFIRNNLKNGIAISNGSFLANNNEISSNIESGIRISGGNQVTIQDNVLNSNGDGIYLTDHLAGEIHIEHNTILLNKQNGIVLAADAYDNTNILNNNVTANLCGFLIPTNTSTYITRNNVWNNTVGIMYTNGGNHEAHFNDIYANSAGMNVTGDAKVDATYNYWGEKNGPYHEGLNPYAKGNPVNGDGVNLDFLFFLTAPIDYINTKPNAILWSDKTLISPYQTVTFIGADSYDDGRVDYFTFDFNDTSKVHTTLSLFEYNYSMIGTYYANLLVIDDFNATSENVATTTVTVTNLAPLSVSVALSNENANFNENLTVTAYVTDGVSPVENANVTLFSIKGGSFDTASALTNSTGQITATFTAPNVTAITDIRIIARAEMSGYADGSDYKYVRVVPPLMVQVVAENPVMKSEASAFVNVDVSLGLGRPVKDALVIMSSDIGDVMPSSNWTDANGRTRFTFTAPQTLSQLVAALTATAIKMEYAEGRGQATITVEPRILVIIATPSPPIVISGDVSTITVQVTSDGTPVSNATLAVTTDVGEVSPESILTDANGMGSFAFTMSGPSVQEEIMATITISASKDTYVSNEMQTNVQVVPKMLAVQITPQPSATYSEATVNLTAHVIYTFDMTSVSDVNVTIMSPGGGNFSRDNGLTDVNGDVTFVFQALQTNEQIDINISALASKSGYVNGQNYTTMTVSPGIFDINVTASSPIASGESLVIEVYVTRNSTAVPNVSVAMTTNYGNFSVDNGVTDSNGRCTLVFNAPQTETQLTATINATVSKNGYVTAENQTEITITPAVPIGSGGGLALTTILLIVIPIIVVVIVVVLVKLKVLSFSVKEEES